MAERDAASRELLLGLYALESGAIDQNHLVMAARAWARSPEKILSEILAGSGLLDLRTLARLEDRIRRELAPNAGSPGPDRGSGATMGDRPDRPSGAEPAVTLDYPGSPLDQGADAGGGPMGEAGGTGTDGRRFQVLRSRARGGLGEVFLAFDAELNRSVAVKELAGSTCPRPGLPGPFPFRGGGHREAGTPRDRTGLQPEST